MMDKASGASHSNDIHGGYEESLLFPGLDTNSRATFALACILLICLTAIIEFIRFLLEKIEKKTFGSKNQNASHCKCHQQCYSTFPVTDQAETIEMNHGRPTEETGALNENNQPSSRKWIGWSLLALFSFIVAILGTIAMLYAMTMNIYFILCLAMGATIGKLSILYLRNKKEAD